MTTHELLLRFQQRLEAVGGQCCVVKGMAEAVDVIVAHKALAGQEVVVSPAFDECKPWSVIVPLLRDKGIRIRLAGTPAEVADAPAGLSGAELAVAETGSVLLAENTLEGRVVSMLTLTHFVLVYAQDLVPTLDEVGTRLQQLTRLCPDQRRYISLVTGPSRTADIERTLTIGVQGPKALCVLVLLERE